MRQLLLVIALLCLGLWAEAQESTLRQRKILLRQGDCIRIDSQAIVQASVQIVGFAAGTHFKVSSDSVCWIGPDMTDSAKLVYRVLRLSLTYSNKDVDRILARRQEDPFAYIPENERLQRQEGSLRTFGNISRGLGFGNAQDVVVNSNLNLRINGTIAGDVEVLAVISDENNPIQPEGNTQQIQDFDQVYITLRKDSAQLTVGDYLMSNSEDQYFMKYYKRSRGLQYQRKDKWKDWNVRSGVEAAISRGRFQRNQIQGIEGNLGPYRLTGTNGELFIIVIAGTERVFLDGKLLQRGEDNDYVINYNTGEVTFTPNVLITQFSRIVVEFQYSDRNYARSVATAGLSLERGHWKVYGQFFNEMDLKNQPFQQRLDAFDSLQQLDARQLLEQAGDGPAFVSQAKASSTFNPDRIMYRIVDSLGTFIYVYTDDPGSDSLFYEVTFSYVGPGQGDYTQIQSAANGKVFGYKGPGLGDYAPLVPLVSPKMLNMYSLGMIYEQGKQRYGAEWSVSQFDQNTFSSFDDGNNIGQGVKVFEENSHALKGEWKLSHRMDYETIGSGFNFIERYRDVEFNRRWNKVISNPQSMQERSASREHIGNAQLKLENGKAGGVSTAFSTYNRPGDFEGYQWMNRLDYTWRKTTVGGQLELLSSGLNMDSFDQTNAFHSATFNVEQALPWFRLGANAQQEVSRFNNSTNEVLDPLSYQYDQVGVYLRNENEQGFSYRLDYNERRDQRSDSTELQASTTGRNFGIGMSYVDPRYNRLSIQTIYRKLDILDTSIAPSANDRSLQTRIELDVKMFSKLIHSKTFLQVASGQEQRREFQYLQVQTGNGLYIWNDYDSNGVKTLNEFEIASELDRARADHIRIYTPVPGFIATRTSKLSESLIIDPGSFFRKKDKRHWLSRFYSISSAIMEQKVLPSATDLIGLESGGVGDSNLINRSLQMRSSLFFNRSHPVFGLDYSIQSNQSKILLTNGFDSRDGLQHEWNIRWNIRSRWTLRTALSQGNRSFNSEFFSNRNFNYHFWNAEPELQFQASRTFRVSVHSLYAEAQNVAGLGGERSEQMEVGLGAKYAAPGKGSLELEASYVRIDFDGQAGSTLGYELLRGLQNGNNAKWTLQYQQRVMGNVQLVLSYDGRKSENAPVIHLGRLLARYLF